MKRKRHTPEQVIRRLREAEGQLANGTTIAEVCKGFGISETTYHRWQNQYGGMKADDAKRLRESNGPEYFFQIVHRAAKTFEVHRRGQSRAHGPRTTWPGYLEERVLLRSRQPPLSQFPRPSRDTSTRSPASAGARTGSRRACVACSNA